MSAAPIEAVILGIDPAKHTSGAVLLVPDYGGMDEDDHPFDGSYVALEFGKVVTQGERERFVQALLDEAEELELPAVVVAEIWDPPHDKKTRLAGGGFAYVRDQKWTYETILGIGEGWGRWSAELERAKEFLEKKKLPSLLVQRVTPNVWRDALFGARRARGSEELKVTACRYFEGVFGYAVSDDIAEAGCIALWGTTSAEVGTLVLERDSVLKAAARPPKKSRRKAA